PFCNKEMVIHQIEALKEVCRLKSSSCPTHCARASFRLFLHFMHFLFFEIFFHYFYYIQIWPSGGGASAPVLLTCLSSPFSHLATRSFFVHMTPLSNVNCSVFLRLLNFAIRVLLRLIKPIFGPIFQSSRFPRSLDPIFGFMLKEI